jgi:hypothetical protein
MSRHSRSRSGGQRHQMTPEWKEQVRVALRSRGVSEQWLASEIARRRGVKKVPRATINKLLLHQASSALVPDICLILGLPPPMVATPQAPDEETQRLISLALEATPDVRRAVILLLQGSKQT